MRRDWDLLRLLLLTAERRAVDLSPYTDEQIRHHWWLLADSPLMLDTRTLGGDVVVKQLTQEGHDFLSWARHNWRWREVREQVTEKGLPETLMVFNEVAGRMDNA